MSTTVESATLTAGPSTELRAFLHEALPKYRAEWGDRNDFEARCAWQRTLASNGWAAPAWPVEYGGRGLSPSDRVRCDAAFAIAGAPGLAGILGINNVGPTISVWGTDEQKAYLPGILTTDALWCQGFSEPDAGSDLAALSTRGVLDGNEFVVNGQKVWTSNGMDATHCQLLVRTDPEAGRHGGLSVLLVPMDLPGIERRPLRQMSGDSDFAEVFFTDVRVPESALLGPLDEGWKVTMTTLGYERAGVIAMAAQLEQDVMRAVEAAKGTVTDPLLRAQLVDRYIEARLVGLLGERALASLDVGARPGPEQSVIKFAWSQVNQRLGETLLDLEGADALLSGLESGADHRFLQSRAATIAAGTTEVMRNILAERVLGLPKG